MFTKKSKFVIITNGDKMADDKTENMALLYEVISDSIDFLFERIGGDYFTLYNLTVDNILAQEVLQDEFDDEDKKELTQIYSRLTGIDMTSEDIRKAIQSLMLRGLQETHISNGSITPDTIGILFSYFISKFEPTKRKVKILDPLAGFGNLLFTIENHLDLDMELFAVENNKNIVNVLKSNADLLDTKLDIHFENTLNSLFSDIDYIVSDFDYYDTYEEGYFPYNVVLHYLGALKDNGYMVLCIPDDFFSFDKDQEFKKNITRFGSIVSLIELPDDFFKQQKKSILIIKKGQFDNKKCLMIKLPTFDDPNEFNQALIRIELWFDENINNKN